MLNKSNQEGKTEELKRRKDEGMNKRIRKFGLAKIAKWATCAFALSVIFLDENVTKPLKLYVYLT